MTKTTVKPCLKSKILVKLALAKVSEWVGIRFGV
jgi:hypothetical protein